MMVAQVAPKLSESELNNHSLDLAQSSVIHAWRYGMASIVPTQDVFFRRTDRIFPVRRGEA